MLLDGWLAGTPDVRAKLVAGATLADIGCGSGRAILKLARAFPRSRFTGYDVFPPQINRARANIAVAGLTGQVRAEVLNGEAGLPEQYDVITTFDVVHDAVDPLALLRAIRQGLRPGGIYLMQEFAAGDTVEENIASGALSAFLYGASVLYCTPASLAHGGAGLGTAGLPESKVRALAERAGFRNVRRIPVENPFHALYEIR